jgi:CBS domain-containing protein
MNDAVTFAPARNSDPARSAPDALPWAGRPVVDRARDVMTRDPDRVACGDTLMEVAGMMRSLLVAFLPVCDEHGDLHGIIALRDLHRVLRPGHPSTATASSLAEEPPVTIGVNDPVDPVWERMAEQRMWLLPVLDGHRLVGVIHYTVRAGRRNPLLNGPRSHRTPTAP